MGAQPKRKYAKARQGKRRNHISQSPPSLENCLQCHSPKLPHHVCPTCGTYAGREVIEVKSTRRQAG